MDDGVGPATAILLVVGDFGVAVLPRSAAEVAQALAEGRVSAELALTWIRESGGERIAADTSGPWRISASPAIRVDALAADHPESDPVPDEAPQVVRESLPTLTFEGDFEAAGQLDTLDAVAEGPDVEELELEGLENEVIEHQPDASAEEHEADVDPFVTAVDEGASRFDALFGATIAGRRIEDAAVRAVPVDTGPTDHGAPRMVPPPPSAPVNPEPVPVDLPISDAPAPSPAAPPAERSVAPRHAALEPTSPEPEPISDVLHDGQTMTAEQFAAFKANRLAQERLASDGRRQPQRPRVTLRVPTGELIELESMVVFGRRPQPRSLGSEASARLVVIDNPYVSGTHAVVRFDGRTVIVTDCSSNGTLLTKPGVPTHALVPGHPTELVDGATLQLTDGLTIAVSIEAL